MAIPKKTPSPLPRLFRYVERGTLPAPDLLALYDPSQNLVIIDKVLFAGLAEHDKRQVLRTHTTLILEYGEPAPHRLAA